MGLVVCGLCLSSEACEFSFDYFDLGILPLLEIKGRKNA